MNWSDIEFWQSTPRKYYACFYSLLHQKGEITPQEKPLTGSEAINDILSTMGKING